MSDVPRSGDDGTDVERWLRRVAARLTRDIVETLLGTADQDEDNEKEGT